MYIPNKFVNGLDVTADPRTEYVSIFVCLISSRQLNKTYSKVQQHRFQFSEQLLWDVWDVMSSFTFAHLISIRRKMKKTGINVW